MSAYKLDREAPTKGVRLQSYLEMPFERLVARFGEPRCGDGVSTLNQWVFSDASGNVYSVYDWKATTMWDRSLVSPARFRELPVYRWHIGAYNRAPWEPFKSWIFNEVAAQHPDVHAARRDKLVALFQKYDSDRLGYLESSQMRAFIRKIATKFRRNVSEQIIEDTLRDFVEVDANGHGKIHKIEFVNFFLTQYEEIPEGDFLEGLDNFDHPTHDVTDQTLRSIFWKLDKDGTGFIPAATLKDVAQNIAQRCKVEYDDDALTEAMSHFAHTDGESGMVAEEEFQTLLLEMFAKVDHRTFLRQTDFFELAVAPDRRELLKAAFHRHNVQDTMQAEEMRWFLARFGKLNGKELDDEQLKTISCSFVNVDSNGNGVVTEREFVDHFIGEMMDTSDFDFHVTVKYLYEGCLNYY
jgi:Ca2+-binding EF-hand superfamily protein